MKGIDGKLKREFEITVRRQRYGENNAYYEKIKYESFDDRETVGAALMEINSQRDDKIEWENSCLQRKCGACAMRINGVPKLACDVRLWDFPGKNIKLEPLKKFQVLADLIVDRSILRENLIRIKAWHENVVRPKEDMQEEGFDSSRCLQCGLCLEICPNFYVEGEFVGTAGFVSAKRIMIDAEGEKKDKIKNNYQRYYFEGCGKSLACRDICPAGINIDKLMVKSNTIFGKIKSRKIH